MADLIAELEGVVRLSEAAAPGPWERHALMVSEAGKPISRGFDVAHCGLGMRANHDVHTAEANAALISAAVNFLRTHHAEIAAAVRDARTEREIQNAARDLPEGYAITIYVEKDSGYIDLTDPDGDPVYVHTDDKTMAQQIAEATKVAAMRAGEGEG